MSSISKASLHLPLVASILAWSGYCSATCLPKEELPSVSGSIVEVSTESQLQSAVSNLQDNTTILLKPGAYKLTNSLYISNANITLRGDGDDCSAVSLVGNGMENSTYNKVPYAVWSNATGLTVINLTIRDIYNHGIILNPGAESPKIQSVHMIDVGNQFVKSNPFSFGDGNDNGVVEDSTFAYTSAPPTSGHGDHNGYTNGVDVHAGKNWIIRRNRFESFHTPDTSSWKWNPAILMWNGSQNTLVENNVFVNVDRAISFGLVKRDGDHSGGIIRNNMVVYEENLMSTVRKSGSDAAIIVWDSAATKVVHNTVLTQGNLNKSIEFRFNTSGSEARNNLVDAPISSRNEATYSQTGNITSATKALFKDVMSGNLRLLKTADSVIGKASVSSDATMDIDGESRAADNKADPGADEFMPAAPSPPSPPENVTLHDN